MDQARRPRSRHAAASSVREERVDARSPARVASRLGLLDDADAVDDGVRAGSRPGRGRSSAVPPRGRPARCARGRAPRSRARSARQTDCRVERRSAPRTCATARGRASRYRRTPVLPPLRAKLRLLRVGGLGSGCRPLPPDGGVDVLELLDRLRVDARGEVLPAVVGDRRRRRCPRRARRRSGRRSRRSPRSRRRRTCPPRRAACLVQTIASRLETMILRSSSERSMIGGMKPSSSERRPWTSSPCIGSAATIMVSGSCLLEPPAVAHQRAAGAEAADEGGDARRAPRGSPTAVPL